MAWWCQEPGHQQPSECHSYIRISLFQYQKWFSGSATFNDKGKSLTLRLWEMCMEFFNNSTYVITCIEYILIVHVLIIVIRCRMAVMMALYRQNSTWMTMTNIDIRQGFMEPYGVTRELINLNHFCCSISWEGEWWYMYLSSFCYYIIEFRKDKKYLYYTRWSDFIFINPFHHHASFLLFSCVGCSCCCDVTEVINQHGG